MYPTYTTHATIQPGSHAVVIGGSIAGLLAARVLTNHYASVTVVERDHLNDTPAFRSGAPHARHAHGLLVRGQQIMESYFPGMRAELVAQGAIIANLGRDLTFTIGNERVNPYDTDLNVVTCSRPLIEHTLAQRLRALPQVQFMSGYDVKSICTDITNTRVTGLRLQKRGASDTSSTEGNTEDNTASNIKLTADLVVDASGRTSKLPNWLQALGYVPPQETTVDAQAGYASRLYRAPHPVSQASMIYGMPKAPDYSRGCILVPIEDDRWIVTLTGLNADHPPTDEAGFMAFAKSVPVPEFYAAIAKAEPLTEPFGFRGGANRLRHYERLPRYLKGLLALGDSVYALNPVYGQGMTVAALGALTLDRCLHEQRQLAAIYEAAPDPAVMERYFFQQLARVNANAWQLATGQDARWPVAASQLELDPITRGVQWYLDHLLEAMVDNGELAESFGQVQNMLKEPTTLFQPRLVWHVLRAKLGKAKPNPLVPQVMPQGQHL